MMLTGTVSYDMILMLIILSFTAYGAYRGGFRMIAPILSFVVARLFTPAVAEFLKEGLTGVIVKMYSESYAQQYPNGYTIANELMDVVSSRMLELIAFSLALAVIRIFFGFVFYEAYKRFHLAGVPNTVIGGAIGLAVSILLIGFGTRIIGYVAPVSQQAAGVYEGINNTSISGPINSTSNLLFDKIIVTTEDVKEMAETGEWQTTLGEAAYHARDVVQQALEDEIPEDLND